MKSLTPKQRGEIYLKVADKMCLIDSDWSLCRQLSDMGDFRKPHAFDFERMFKIMVEFELFKPSHDNEERDFFYCGSGWWDISDRNVRQTCMLLCYEMTKTQKQ